MAEPSIPIAQAIRESPAPIRPRARAGPDGEVLPLEDLVLPAITAHGSGAIAICGPLGSGKTTALEHLAGVLPRDAKAWVCWLDEPDGAQVSELAGRSVVVYTTAGQVAPLPHLLAVDLTPWSQDDVIEYLLARHRTRCASVMARLKSDTAGPRLSGLPELCRIVLDEMAADETLPGAASALLRRVDVLVPDPDLRRQAGELGLFWLLEGKSIVSAPPLCAPLPFEVRRLAHHRFMSLLLAAGLIVDQLNTAHLDECWSFQLPRELIQEVAERVRTHEPAMACLRRMARGSRPEVQPMATSVLAAADPSWHPRRGWPRRLVKAYLGGVRWAGANLQRADLSGTDMLRADLSGANLRHTRLHGTNLRQARLSRARLSRCAAARADFSLADMSHVLAVGANFQRASFVSAQLSAATLRRANLTGACLDKAVLTCTDLREALLSGTQLEGADLGGADLTKAHLDHVRLCGTQLTGACFEWATLVNCDLEGVHLPRARFGGAVLEGCLLTGSLMPRANFRGANLGGAGLAEIQWENADLRDANLQFAAFHLGSSRSGLVDSITPSEGSRTGFYSDDFTEQNFKAPEEIRKANLCGADLRGAILMDTDFYLVDLRGAKYTPEQGKHFARCGAILVDRVR